MRRRSGSRPTPIVCISTRPYFSSNQNIYAGSRIPATSHRNPNTPSRRWCLHSRRPQNTNSANRVLCCCCSHRQKPSEKGRTRSRRHRQYRPVTLLATSLLRRLHARPCSRAARRTRHRPPMPPTTTTSITTALPKPPPRGNCPSLRPRPLPMAMARCLAAPACAQARLKSGGTIPARPPAHSRQ